jgi:hypothetical protein
MERNVGRQLQEIDLQTDLTDELIDRAEILIDLADALEARAARLVELAERLDEQSDELLAIARRLDLRSAELLEMTARGLDVAERQLAISELLTTQFDESLAIQREALGVGRATLQEVREINDKIPPPTGGGIVPGAETTPDG